MAGEINSFEGGSDTVAISTGNSGGLSGAAFTATANITFSGGQAAHGALSGRVTTGVDGYVEHTLSGSGLRYARAYVYVGDSAQMLRLVLSGTGNSYRLSTTASSITFSSEVNSSIFTLGSHPSAYLNQWVRVEMRGASDAAGAGEARIYLGDATTAVATLTGTAARTAGTWAAVRYGGLVNGSTTRYIDDVGWSDVDWLGPAAEFLPRAVVAPTAAVHRASRW